MSPRSLTIYELVLKPYEANFTNTTTMPRYQKVLLAGNSGLAGKMALWIWSIAIRARQRLLRKVRPYSRKKIVTKMIKATLLGYLTAIFSVRGLYLSLISFVPLIAIWDIYWESLKNEDWFCVRGDLLERPKKIWSILDRGMHTWKIVLMKVHMVMSYSWKTT